MICSIATKYIECEDKINDLSKDLEKGTLKVLTLNIEELTKSLKVHEKLFEEAENEVNKFREDLKAAVDKSCDTILKELKEKEIECCVDIKKTIRDLENKLKDTERFISLCGAKIRKGGIEIVQFSKVSPPSDTFIPSLTLPSLSVHDVPFFVPANALVNNIMRHVGEIKWENGSDNKSIESTDLKVAAGDEETSKSDKTMPCINVKVINTFDVDIWVGSVVPTGEGTAWVANLGSDTMYMYGNKGAEIRSVCVANGKKIGDLAVQRSGGVIVRNNDQNVRILSANGKVRTLLNTAPFSGRGVCLTEKGEIMVCVVGKPENHLVMYAATGGKIIKEIVVRDRRRKHLLSNPTRVVVYGDNVTVMNFGSNVITSDHDGNIRWVYDGAKAGPGKFDPRGMCVDKFSNLLVSDFSNNKVHYIDKQGGLIQILLTYEQHGIKNPLGIGVDNEAGEIWLGTRGYTMNIFKYLKN